MNKSYPATLIVVHGFGRYSRGQMINDPASIAAILNGGNAACVVAVVLPAVAVRPEAVTEH